ncbi:uncharacterized protein LOC119397415 [Rhipicephalus sanguineus]|uniref:uncharacterized protein LOC119397415 n=1 Tax=Rhipicephalus sanguineus TaxID=34632 RepID=UPI001895A05A|nr:uncharacterized protein LOC119397415 [Rhipicephalus sanguineus]
MRGIIEQLRAEVAELKKSSNSHAQPSVIVTDSPQPMEVPVGADETSSGHPAKRRAVSSNADSAANRAKSEIREVLNSLSTDIKQLGEQLSSFRAGVAQHFAAMNARIENLELQVKGVPEATSRPVVDGNAPPRVASANYPHDTAKGRSLWQKTSDFGFSLVTDPAFPTRRGTSTTRDSVPDLTFVKNVDLVKWSNLMVDLGSDHYITTTTFEVSQKKLRAFSITDWDRFRKIRRERADHGEKPEGLEQWTGSIMQDVRESTKMVQTDLQTEKIDSRLAHLLEAKQSLLERWKGQCLNRRLRKKIAEVNKVIEEHCQTLSRQQWDDICNSIDGQVRTQGKWNLLKHLLDETGTKSNQRRVLAKTLHEATRSSTEKEVLDYLAKKYLPLKTSDGGAYTEYSGKPNSTLDEPFTIEGIRRALHDLNGRSTPGPDGVTNKALRNLDDESVEFLADEINRIWKEGAVPEQWKIARVILIPKPGKPPSLESLRPISLTSCVGKVAEHVIHNKITVFIEENELFPHNMVGFRPVLSTQDAMRLIKTQILDSNTRDTRAILGLDLEKAFDNIHHSFILDSISNLDLGAAFHAFVRSFLEGRSALLKVGEIGTDKMALSNRGTQQGSVISPLLFNIAMVGLSEGLGKIQGIGHTVYADDITIWCAGGSDGHIESALQEAIDCTESFLQDTGLRCSPSKSELLLYRPSRRGRKPKDWKPLAESDINLHTKSGDIIPRVASIRILGMIVESSGTNSQTILRLAKKTDSTIGLIRRVANRRSGLAEDNLVRLIHAFLLCHFTCVAAMHVWRRAERIN